MKKISVAFVVLSFLLPVISSASIDANLKYGVRGTEVTELQNFLISKGFLTGQATGNFFTLTKKAVVAYQTSVGVPSTGFVGPLTRTEINNELSKNTSQEETRSTAETTPSADKSVIQKQLDDLLKQIAQLNGQINTQNKTAQQITPSNVPISVPELKKQDPQQYKALVSENKTQLLQASQILSNKNIIARVKPSVVYIETTSKSGSGIIVSADGYILTNAHVVTGFSSATIKFTNGGSFIGNVVGRDEIIDLALIKVSTANLSPAFLGDSDSVEQGDPVFTLGYPLGIEGDVSFKDGTLSRRLVSNGIGYLEISAQILPGNSGGPLVDQAGEVIGVNTFAIGTGRTSSGILVGETLKFALPINIAKDLIPQLKNGRNIFLPKPTTPTPATPAIPAVPGITPAVPATPATPATTTPPVKDITPPVIINVQNTNTTSTGTVITWSTNETSTGLITVKVGPFGVDSVGRDIVAIANGLSFSVIVDSLLPSTEYYVRVKATDTAGNVSIAYYNFTTLPPPPLIVSIPQFLLKWGSLGQSSDSTFTFPEDVTVDTSGNVYVTGRDDHRVQKFTNNGTFVAKWGGNGTGDGQFQGPEGIAVDGAGNVYIGDRSNARIQKFTSSGVFVTKWGSYGTGDGQFKDPWRVAVDSSGNVYVADATNYRVQKFTSTGTFITKWGSQGTGDGQFDLPRGIVVDNNGNIYVADRNNNRIQKFDSNGVFLSTFGSFGTGNGQFNHPAGIALDTIGNLYVVDADNNRIQMFDSNGIFILKWGVNSSTDGQFNTPRGIAIDSNNNIFIADTDSHRIQKFK